MQWANPMWLWGLLGLAVPVAVHLLSRKEGKVIKIGSIRHLRESATRQFRSLKPNELLLFALRCLLIMLLTALLAGLQWKADEKPPQWVLLERGVESQQEVKRLTDSLSANGYEVRYLESGFPVADDTLPAADYVNYWHLVHQLRGARIERAVVFSHSFVKNFKGKRMELPDNISWFEVPAAERHFELPSIAFSEDSLLVAKGFADANGLTFEERIEKRTADSNVRQPLVASVSIVADEKYQSDAAILEAALGVLHDMPQFDLVLSNTLEDTSSSEWIFWLSDQPLPQKPGAKIVSLAEQEALHLLEHQGPDHWLLTQRLTRESAVEQHLVAALAGLLHRTEPRLIKENDRRMMPAAWRWSAPAASDSEPSKAETVYTKKDDWLMLAFLMVLLTERLVAWRRKQ